MIRHSNRKRRRNAKEKIRKHQETSLTLRTLHHGIIFAIQHIVHPHKFTHNPSASIVVEGRKHYIFLLATIEAPADKCP